MLPEPLYFAYAGYGQSARVRPGNGFPVAGAVPRMVSGALPFSTQSTSGENASMLLVPGPPPQWFTPGFVTFDAKLGYDAETWSFALVGKNLANQRYFIPYPFAAGRVAPGEPLSVFAVASLRR